MSFMVVNALSYALHTVYHDIDTTTLVLDVLVFFKKINLYKNFTASRKMFKFIYLYIFQNKVKLSSSKYFWYTYVRDAVRCFSTRGSRSQDYATVDIYFLN